MQPSSVSFARVDVLDREGGFHGVHAAHMVRLAATRLRRATVDDPRLVEMEVGLDQACAAKTPLGIVRGHIGLDARRDRLDPPAGEADVDEAAIGGGRQARVANDEVEHWHLQQPFTLGT
jgi:hypothetical protein